MAVEVGSLTSQVEAYEQCKTSDAQHEDIAVLQEQLSLVASYMNSTNVAAWSQALIKANGVLACADVPLQWCTGVVGPNGLCIADTASGTCEEFVTFSN